MNPWVTLLPETQIIEFEPSGNVIKKGISAARLISYRPKARVTNTQYKQITELNEDIGKLTRKIYRTSKSQHTSKVFTNCNKQTRICQFVTCPNIKESCFLCTTYMVPPLYDNTDCVKINTGYLSLNVKGSRKENRSPTSSII